MIPRWAFLIVYFASHNIYPTLGPSLVLEVRCLDLKTTVIYLTCRVTPTGIWQALTIFLETSLCMTSRSPKWAFPIVYYTSPQTFIPCLAQPLVLEVRCLDLNNSTASPDMPCYAEIHPLRKKNVSLDACLGSIPTWVRLWYFFFSQRVKHALNIRCLFMLG